MTVKFREDEKFVTDCIYDRKGNFSLYSTLRLILVAFNGYDQIFRWLQQNENICRFVDAWRYGYEIEEKKYPIKLVDGRERKSLNSIYYCFELNHGNPNVLCAEDIDDLSYYEDNDLKVFFTEEEIKAINPAYWALREEVEDDE